MKEFARAFYKSAAWQRASKVYMQQHNYICERCGKPAAICHHKKYLNPANIRDCSVSLNPDNLECLCQECHNREHSAARNVTGFVTGVAFDEQGNVVKGLESNDRNADVYKC